MLLKKKKTKDNYPLPRIDDNLDVFVGSALFSRLNLKSGYWKIEIDPADRGKAAFTPETGLWQFSYALVYLDNILVMIKTFDERIKNLKELFQTKVNYLGHVVSSR